MLGKQCNAIDKSQKMVGEAVGVFEKAKQKIDKANELLLQSIEQDTAEIAMKQNKIITIEKDILALKQCKQSKGAEIKKNDELLEKLSQFTK